MNKFSTIQVEGKDVYLVANCLETFETANYLCKGFLQSRLISVEGNILNAVSAAYKTASGLHSLRAGVIAKSIYHMSKVDVAMLIASNDTSDDAFDQAAYELAQDALVTGKLEERAQELAEAIGRGATACMLQIYEKRIRLEEAVRMRSNKLMAKGTAPQSAEHVRDEILFTGGKYLLSLPTAYGKTSLIIEPVLQRYLDGGKKVLVISHRRSINRNIANLQGIVSYDACSHPDVIEQARGLKIVVNSLSAPKFKAFIEAADLVVVDEAAQVISHVLGGEVKNREAVWDALQFVVKRAKTVILADADINRRCANLAGPDARLFKVKQEHKDITVRTGDINQVRALAIAAAAAGQNVLIACDVVKEAAALAKSIEKVGRKTLVITAATAKWDEQAAFIANPNSTEHGVVIFSPVITSALSITNKHFDAHFGVFSGQIVPTDAIQMLRRDRTVSTLTVGIKSPEYRKTEIVDVRYRATELNAHSVQQQVKLAELDRELAAMSIGEDSKRRIRELFLGESKSLDFELLQYHHLADEAWLKDRIQTTLPATLLEQGFKLEVLELDEELRRAGFSSNSAARKAVKREVVTKLLQSPDRAGADIVDEGDFKHEAEQLAAIRAKAQRVMRRSELSIEDLKLWGDGEGEGKIRRFRKLYSLPELVPDEGSAIALIRHTVDVMSESNLWTSQQSIELFDKLNTMRADVIKEGVMLSNARTAQAKVTSTGLILKQFGLKATKVDGGNNGFYFKISRNSLDHMKTFL